MWSSVYANPHFSDPILSHIDYKDYYAVNTCSASPYYAVSFFLWDVNTSPRFSLLLWQQQWAECSVRYHLCYITSGDWKWHSMIPQPLMADGTAEEGQEERGGGSADVQRTGCLCTPRRHHNDRCQRCTQVKRMWLYCDGKERSLWNKKNTVEERHPRDGQVLFRTVTDDVTIWTTGRK